MNDETLRDRIINLLRLIYISIYLAQITRGINDRHNLDSSMKDSRIRYYRDQVIQNLQFIQHRVAHRNLSRNLPQNPSARMEVFPQRKVKRMRRVLVLISARTLRLSTLLNLPREAKAFNTSNVIIYLFSSVFLSFFLFSIVSLRMN